MQLYPDDSLTDFSALCMCWDGKCVLLWAGFWC